MERDQLNMETAWVFGVFFNFTCFTALGDDTLQTLVLQTLTFCIGVSGRFPKQLF